ncbi:Tryptophan aminotransferase-related protein 4 [Heracleum sosnowskyi]|uniref:Tryptophan aminotransferase-related protein 4 n=1 Tax=Heracleum sosnowskyi TaxID=360622 RepID=A0AAD8MGN8_9APIA|nr:Tryptophan aminotransferase-related protein 4 [Heracleum sosnowskyi]
MGVKTDQSLKYNKYAYVCFLCSVLVNIFLSYNLFVGKKWSLSWSTNAAAEAEAVASISCSGHGRAYLDGVVVDGKPVCECNTCYDGPDCSNYILDCPSDVNSGDPLFLEPFWMQNAASSALVVSGWHRMSYQFGDHTATSQELEKSIRKLHSIVGNAVTEGKYIVFGTGSTQLLNAAVLALSQDNSSTPSKVFVSIPFYPAYEEQTEFFATEDYEFYGDTSLYKNNSDDTMDMIEFVTSPNNPDGKLKRSVLKSPSAKAIHDHAYYWPHFTAIPSPSDEDLMIFTLSKLTGHAGVRFGWALVKDKAVYEKILTYTGENTFGVSKDTQLRALKLLNVALQGDGRSLFKYAHETMRNRWESLTETVSLSTRFTVQEIAPRFCTYFQNVRGPSPAYAWLKCEREEDELCYKVLEDGGILGRPGTRFGASSRYVRLSLIKTQDDFDQLLQHLKILVLQEAGGTRADI